MPESCSARRSEKRLSGQPGSPARPACRKLAWLPYATHGCYSAATSRNRRLRIHQRSRVPATSVEREIFIEAPPEIVWGVITEPEQISSWFSDDADIEPRSGMDGTLTWKPGGRGGEVEADLVVPIRVVDAEPFRRFSFRWNHQQGVEPDESNSALVEFRLIEEDGATRLKVVESGIDAVAHDVESSTRYRAEHEDGWEKHFAELLDYLASNAGRAS
ncbi:MAG TPA: SRPBCC domain-containing protein [Solirubrobacteraceae bacterium]|nr:SRPBCC domain-containing protein [Solirubrobacteraceae bacterium]